MIKSKYIYNIIKLLLDGDDEGLSATDQLPFITERKIEYTSSGLFVNFTHSKEIIDHKVIKPDLVLTGVKIKTTEFSLEAEATLFFKDGLINYLEIWCYDGDYPKQNLTKYTLTQTWNNSPGKIITTEN